MEQRQLINEIQIDILDEAPQEQDHLFKLLVIGDSGVGKTQLMNRIMNLQFQGQHQPTIGVEFGSFAFLADNQVIKLQVWDTAGQKSFKSVTRVFYKGSNIIFLLYDITNKASFEDLPQYLQDIKSQADKNVRIYLIGNKADQESQRQI